MVFIMTTGGANSSSHANMEHWQPLLRECYMRKTIINMAHFQPNFTKIMWKMKHI